MRAPLPSDRDWVDPQGIGADRGSLVVEFALMTVALLVPLAWAGLSLQQLSAVQQAAHMAAGEALAAFVRAPDDAAARLRGQAAAELALAPHGAAVRSATVGWSCSMTPCLQPGARVTAIVSVEAEAPTIPLLGIRPAAGLRAEQTGAVDAFAYPG